MKDGDPRKVDGGRKKMQINDIKKKKTMIFGQRDRGSLGDPALTRIPDRALAHFWIPVESNSKKNPGDPKNVRPCRCRLFLFLRMISLLCFFFFITTNEYFVGDSVASATPVESANRDKMADEIRH